MQPRVRLAGLGAMRLAHEILAILASACRFFGTVRHPAIRSEHEDEGVGHAASRRALQEVQFPRAKRGGNVPVSGVCSVGYAGTAGVGETWGELEMAG